MKSLHRLLALGSVAASLALTAGSLQAQNQNQNPPQQGQGQGQGGTRQRGPGGPGGGGNFDPAQFREQMMQRMRERFEVKDDEEWKLISERLTKVQEIQRTVRSGGGFSAFGGRPGGGPPGGGGDNNSGRTRGGTTGGGTFGRESDPEMEALQRAIEAKAPAEEIKVKLARYRDALKEKEAKLEKAQQDLREVLSARQEAVAVTMGLLK
jgi:hypothetical protein